MLTLCPAITLAHIDLVTASPGKDEVVVKPIQTIRLKLSGKVEPKFSKIEVIEVASKNRMDSGEIVIDEKQDALSISLKGPLKAGKYHVKWKATSIDAHKAHGEYDFTFAPKE